MKSMNSPQGYWQGDQVSTDLKIHKLQEELQRVTLENSKLLEKSGVSDGWVKELTGYEGDSRKERREDKRREHQ